MMLEKIRRNRSFKYVSLGLLLGAGLLLVGRSLLVNAAQKNAIPAEGLNAVQSVLPESNKVLVKIGDETLTAADARRQIEPQLAQYGQQLPEDQRKKIADQMLEKVKEQFVVTTLLRQEAEKENVVVNEEDVQQAVEEIKGQLPEGITYEQVLQMQNMTDEELRGQLKEDLGVKKMLDQKVPQPEVSQEEVKNFYEENKEQMKEPESVHARHILIKVDEDAEAKEKAEKKAEAEAIRKELDEGADFAEMAKEKSDDGSAATGGDLGTFTRGRMVPEFEEAAFSQEVNEVGEVVETQFGYHIIEVLEHNEERQNSLEEVSEQIAEHLANQERQQAFQAYIETLKEKTDIQYPAE